MIVIVCGGRKYDNAKRVNEVLDRLHKNNPITLLVHGGANGADRLGYLWAVRNEVSHKAYNAQWGKYGPSAGPIRNKKMLNHSGANLVVAFPGTKGTAHMVSYAKAKQVPVMEISDEVSTGGIEKEFASE